MKPARFEYQRVKSVDEALAALAVGGSEAKLVAGGQSLGPMLNLRLVRPSLLVDISDVSTLKDIDTSSVEVRLGAAITHAYIEDEFGAIDGLQPLAHAARGIAYRAVRNRGTVGGSLAHADPAADWPLILSAWGAEIELQGHGGTRRVNADVFMHGAYVTAMRDGELLTAVHLPRLSRQGRWAYRKFCRKPGEFAEAAVAMLFDPERRVARVFVGAPAARPTALSGLAAEIARQGRAALSDERIFEASMRVLADVAPTQRQICQVMLRRALEDILS